MVHFSLVLKTNTMFVSYLPSMIDLMQFFSINTVSALNSRDQHLILKFCS